MFTKVAAQWMGCDGKISEPPEATVCVEPRAGSMAAHPWPILGWDAPAFVAADNATFGLPEVKRGLTANGGGLLRLHQRVPYSFAMELVLTGRMLPAKEAAELHLINRLAAPGHALEVAMELADAIAKNAPLASKQVMVNSVDWTVDEKFARQKDHVAPIRTSSDAAEGARAFIEKREPAWSGS